MEEPDDIYTGETPIDLHSGRTSVKHIDQGSLALVATPEQGDGAGQR